MNTLTLAPEYRLQERGIIVNCIYALERANLIDVNVSGHLWTLLDMNQDNGVWGFLQTITKQLNYDVTRMESTDEITESEYHQLMTLLNAGMYEKYALQLKSIKQSNKRNEIQSMIDQLHNSKELTDNQAYIIYAALDKCKFDTIEVLLTHYRKDR